ncbi:DUF748 domain-containing protein [Motiliproteus sp. SC1-56]|uniref:DUF748 domain-containing protein n=1 Tax=Motiliproteus sp. SC1-56 TaxID=2799565 RepID=UPI001A8E058D|nr:DUF748 domain-containing protein [Motiliproteus sp. SC1-56]
MLNRKTYILLSVVALLLLITLAPPLLARWQLAKQLENFGAEQVDIKGLYLNIWTGFLHLQGLEATGQRGELRVGDLQLDLEIPALFQRRLHLDRIALSRTFVPLVQGAEGWQAGPLLFPPAQEPAADEPRKSAWSWGLSQLALDDIEVTATLKQATQRLYIDQASLDLLRTWEPGQASRIQLEGQLNESALKITSNATPFAAAPAADSQLRIEALQLGPLLNPWMPVPVEGALTTDLSLTFSQDADGLLLAQEGSIDLQNVRYGEQAGIGQVSWQGSTRAAVGSEGLRTASLDGTLELNSAEGSQPDVASGRLEGAAWEGTASLARSEAGQQADADGTLTLRATEVETAQGAHLSQAQLRWQGTAQVKLETEGAVTVSTRGNLNLADIAARQPESALELALGQLQWEGTAELAQTEGTLSDLQSQHRLTLDNLELGRQTMRLAEKAVTLEGTLVGNGDGLDFEGTLGTEPLSLTLPHLQLGLQALAWQGGVGVDLAQGSLKHLSGDARLEQMALQDDAGAPLAALESLALENLSLPQPDLYRAQALVLGPLQVTLDKATLLQLEGVDVSQLSAGPKQAEVEQINVGALKTGVVTDKQGRPARWSRWLTKVKGAPAADTAPASPAQPDDAEPVNAPEAEPFAFRLGKLQLSAPATLAYTGATVHPPTTLTLTLAKLQVEQLDSSSEAPGPFSVQGRINRFGELTLDGQYAWFAPKPTGNWKGGIEDLSLPPFSPYMARYTGYQLSSGQLYVDTQGTLDKGLVKSQNELRINNLQVKHQAPEAAGAFDQQLGMPLETAISILTDGDNNVALSLPIEGSLDDPEFGYQSIINTVMANVTKKAAMAYLVTALQPYGALIALTRMAVKQQGSAIELAPVYFAPGSDELDPEALNYLAKLEGMLKERDGIRLNLCGTAVKADAEALGAIADTQPPVAGASQAARSMLVSEAQLRILNDLAQRRADRVMDYLQQAAVNPKQLFGCLPEVDSTSTERPRVKLGL